MNKITDRSLKEYYREISRAIPWEGRQKAVFMKELKDSIGDYLATNEDADMDRLIADFGTPGEISKSFLENADTSAIKKKLDVKKYVLIFLGALLIIYLIFVAVSLIDVHTEAHGYLEEGIMMIDTVKDGGIL